ncbi:MAG: ABC transporter substrate-binding protein [Pseudomonadota bacterium]|nr:ABC transporter substrate-binding protein [Pseudomonadota bacterium]|tara:strand:- start:69 stop:653 length:585 start_codon:yes stop_codon:yes gene_type:complete
MKKFIIIFFLIFNFQNYLSAYSSDPKDFISEMINETITVLSNKTLTQDEKSIFIEKIALENVDIKGLSLYTLGEIRKTIDKPQLKRFQISFEKYFLKTLTSRLSDYSGSKFEVINADIKSSNYTIINSKLTPEDGGPEVKIDWRVYTKNPEKPLIRDLIVEGLSLARTQKEEFASILNSNNNNLEALIKKLEQF